MIVYTYSVGRGANEKSHVKIMSSDQRGVTNIGDFVVTSKSSRIWRSEKGANCLSLGPSPACKPKLQQAGAYYLVSAHVMLNMKFPEQTQLLTFKGI